MPPQQSHGLLDRFDEGFGFGAHRESGPREEALEGAHGFLRAYGDGSQPEQAAEGLWKRWETLRTGVKPYPSCRYGHAAIDAALVLQSFVLGAETAGLGCCPISALRNHADKVAAVLCLPDKVFPVAGLCVGYPAATGYVSMRLPLAVTVHSDRYDDARLGAAVEVYDTGRNARYAIPREQQRSPEDYREYPLCRFR